ncbi:MAG: hypothetical protein R3F40_04020 [Candidatus Competibacteraceae bacterium]
MAHSSESEWQSFRGNNKNNEAFLDRVYIVKVPYCLRVSDEVRIYRNCSPTARCRKRLRPAPENAGPVLDPDPHQGTRKTPAFSQMRVYDGENLKDTDPRPSRCRNIATTPGWTKAR